LINITRNSANTVALTLTEKGTATYYLFKFQSDNTEEVEYCVATDSSAYPERFNKFVITEQTSPDNLAAQIELPTEGQWRYFVFANSSASNLDPDGLTELESGIVKVTGTSTPVTSYSGGNSTYVVYGS
jgi:hypothetical protein|tara:strand:- start:270 stop:656 length:387 start_codon:yes stop_codon:yes gene_type:complete